MTRARFDPERLAELERLVGGLRVAIEACGKLDAPLAELASVADRIEALAGDLDARAGARPMSRFEPFDARAPEAMLPFSPVTGRYNPLAPPVALSIEHGDPRKVIGLVRFGDAYEGPPSAVHGSIVAAVYDQLLAFANVANDTGGPTASLTVHYRKPTPLRTDLRFEAWTDRVEGRKVFARGRCLADGEIVSECEGLFVKLLPEQAAKVWARGRGTAE
jgi:acyl-coenzyme A thioesterase PaaI-like protein